MPIPMQNKTMQLKTVFSIRLRKYKCRKLLAILPWVEKGYTVHIYLTLQLPRSDC